MTRQRVVRRYRWLVPITVVLMAGAAVAVSPGETAAQARPEPKSVQELVRRYVDALGGEAALRRITSRRIVTMTRMKFADTLPEFESRGEQFFQAPDRYLMRIHMGTAGTIDMGVNGSVGWSASPVTEPAALDSAQAATLLRTGRIIPSYGGRTAIEFLGRRTLDGRAVYAVRFRVDTSASWGTDYYDAESGLKVGMDIEGPSGATTGWHMRYEDYRWVDRERVAFRTRMLSGGKTIGTVEVVSVDHAPLDTTLFTPPAALLKSR